MLGRLECVIVIVFNCYFSLSCLFLFASLLSIHHGRILSSPSISSFTPIQPYPLLMPSLTPVTPPMSHTVALVPHQPSYRAPTDRIFYMVHTCQPACLNRVRPAKSDIHRGKNPLLTPLLYDFRRMTGRRRVNRKVNVDSCVMRTVLVAGGEK